MESEKIENLNCLVKKNQNENALIIFHGYGANNKDLAPLSDVMNLNVDWYFPNAPISLMPTMFGESRAWFSIDMVKLDQALRSGNYQDFFSSEAPKGFFESLEQIKALIKILKKRYKKVSLGGFSQGAMLSARAFLEDSLELEKLLMFSGALIDEKMLENLNPSIVGQRTFQTHGKQDPVLPYPLGEKLCQTFKNLNPDHEFHAFNGAHEIPPEMLKLAEKFYQEAT